MFKAEKDLKNSLMSVGASEGKSRGGGNALMRVNWRGFLLDIHGMVRKFLIDEHQVLWDVFSDFDEDFSGTLSKGTPASGRPPAGLRPACGRPPAGLRPANGRPSAGRTVLSRFFNASFL